MLFLQFCHGKGLQLLHEKSYSPKIYNMSVFGVYMKNNKEEMIIPY
jgi:hypothetical protein